MTNWFYYNEKGEKIAVTGGQLKGLAKAGLITPGTMIEAENGKSAPAGKVKGLTFGTMEAIPVESTPPKPAQPIAPNPFSVPSPATDNPFIGSMSNESFLGITVYQKWITWGLYLTSVVIVLYAFGVLAGTLGSRTSGDGRFVAGNGQEGFNVGEQAGVKDNIGNPPVSAVKEIESVRTTPPYIELKGHADRVLYSAFSPDGKRIVTTGSYDDKTARIWDAESGRELRKLVGHTHNVNAAAFSPDGRKVVTVSVDKTVRIWDVESGRELQKLRGDTDPISTVAFSPDGKKIVADRLIWDTVSGKELHELVGHTKSITSVAFSPDGKKIVTASNDKTARIWDTDSGKMLQKLEGHTDTVETATFSPDGQKIVTGGYREDRTARIWDAESGKELRKLVGHTDIVDTAAFSPDGAKIVTHSWDDTARIWDTESGKELKKLEGYTGSGGAIVFLSDSTKLVTCGTYEAQIWTLE